MNHPFVRHAALALTGAALVLTAACGGDDDDNPKDSGDGNKPAATQTGGSATRPAGSFSDDAGYCDVKITGDVEAEFRAPGGPSAVGADYFMSKDELSKALKFLGENPTDAELNDDEVDLFLLLLNCVSKDGVYSISFFPGADSKYSDVPFRAGNYVIVPGGVLGGDAARGQFGVLATIKDLSMGVSEPGKFNITAWNKDHIAGDFAFAMKEPEFFATGTPKSVKVTGKFDLKAP